MKKALITVIILLSAFYPAPAEPLYGKVIKVIDGDTIEVIIGNEREVVRVYGINSPERGQPHWKAAKNLMEKMTMGKRVKLLTRGRGKYGRLLAFVMVDKKSAGLELVKSGLARVYSNSFAPDNPQTYERYKKAQIHAMSGDLGIWRGVK